MELTIMVHRMRSFVDYLGRTLDSKARPFLHSRTIYVLLGMLKHRYVSISKIGPVGLGAV